MEKTNFVMPATGYPMTDFQQHVMEIILNLSADLGSLEKANEAMFRMFELSFRQATEQELSDFTKVQGAFRCINQLAVDHSQTFKNLLDEQRSYRIE